MSTRGQAPKLTDVKPKLTVIGVGGAGCNAVNNMIASGLTGVDFVVANTDAQALATSAAEHRLQLGVNLTEGLGAGSRPEIGEAAAEEALEEIRRQVAGSHMVFVAAGMGGGTGTGAAAVIARAAKEMGILTVGVITKPFLFEGVRRMRQAETGVAEIRKHVDTLIVIPNQNLFRIASEKTTFAEAFLMADQVLYSGIACIVDLIIKEGLINLDFADVRTVMSGMGTAMMGTGEASGDRRASLAAEEAISNPLLDDVSLKGAKGLLLSITGGRDLTLYEVDEAASRVRQEVDAEANIIVGATFDDTLGDRVRVSIVASGMSRTSEGVRAMMADVEAAPMQKRSPMAEPRAEEGDVRRRLSEALQSVEAPYGESSDEQLVGSRRETWRAPGNVLIEEGPPQLSQPTHLPPPLPPVFSGATRDAAEPFMPAAPAEIRRQGRRVPDITEFPPIGQRAYRALAGSDHVAQAPTARARPDAEPPRRLGLFERIAGRGRREIDSHGADTHGSSRETQHERDEGYGARRDGSRVESDSRSSGRTSRGDEAYEVPTFFSRGRK